MGGRGAKPPFPLFQEVARAADNSPINPNLNLPTKKALPKGWFS